MFLNCEYGFSMRKEVATTQSHAEEVKNPINCIDPKEFSYVCHFRKAC